MSAHSIALGVNVDHVATLRQVRRATYPDPLDAALVAERAGADSITIHLREDRRHIQDHDVRRMSQALQTRMNFEMAVTDEMLRFARDVRPADCCLVPEKRTEVTTEGGLDVVEQRARIADACRSLAEAGIRASLFIDPDREQIDAALAVGAPVIELHTGAYADATGSQKAIELERLRTSARHAASFGLVVNAGHGLNYHNVQPVAAIPEIVELNIGHSIIARAVLSGLDVAVRDMRALMQAARA